MYRIRCIQGHSDKLDSSMHRFAVVYWNVVVLVSMTPRDYEAMLLSHCGGSLASVDMQNEV